MKLFRRREEDLADIHYEGKVVPRMLSYLKPHVKTIAICLLLVLVLTALELYRPMLTGDAIDLFIAGDYAPGEAVEERFAGLLFTAGKYALALLITFVCNNRMMYLLQRMGQRIVYEMRRELFEHIESLSMRFFDLTPVGKIVTRVTNGPRAVRQHPGEAVPKRGEDSGTGGGHAGPGCAHGAAELHHGAAGIGADGAYPDPLPPGQPGNADPPDRAEHLPVGTPLRHEDHPDLQSGEAEI